MPADTAVVLLFVAVLALIASAARPVPQMLPPPQIVYVREPGGSGLVWVLLLIVVFLLLTFPG